MKFHKHFLVLPAIMAIFSSALLAQEIEEVYFSQAELDQMLAPIALYPDVLLSQVLIAATYPLEVVEASRWSQANPGMEGDEAVRAVEDMPWDPSVKSLVGFPDLIELMDENLTWTRRLGDAFLIQEKQVMETVQVLRSKALETGNLASLEHVTVEQSLDQIIIEPARVEVVYVPYYSTRIVYGDWWWPNYPPIYWHARPAYYSSVGFSWSRGFRVSTYFYYSSCDWRRRNIVIHYHNRHRDRYDFRHVRDRHNYDDRKAHVWRHEPVHRKGVHYRSEDLNTKYDRKRVVASSRERQSERVQSPERSKYSERRKYSEQTKYPERSKYARDPNYSEPESTRNIQTRNREVRREIPDRRAQFDKRISSREEQLASKQRVADKRLKQKEPRESVKPPPSRQAPPPEKVRADPPAYNSRQVNSSSSSNGDRRYTERKVANDSRYRGVRERSPKSRIKRSMD